MIDTGIFQTVPVDDGRGPGFDDDEDGRRSCEPLSVPMSDLAEVLPHVALHPGQVLRDRRRPARPAHAVGRDRPDAGSRRLDRLALQRVRGPARAVPRPGAGPPPARPAAHARGGRCRRVPVHPDIAARFPMLAGLTSAAWPTPPMPGSSGSARTRAGSPSSDHPTVDVLEDAAPGPHGPVPVRIYGRSSGPCPGRAGLAARRGFRRRRPRHARSRLDGP